ncbi:unnamed protein product [Orchesella dallaii]|uniref:2'-5'-oligoadenylate synthetase 1 domain-containing protein n=1 Tax=Orchesella dallaii TaxID=48710 RepID=A0ABP1S6T7_9HEXA
MVLEKQVGLILWLNKLLTEFGQSLRCSEEFYQEGTRLANRLFEKLKQKSIYPINRAYFGGSVGKKTDVIEPDLDIVVFCNNVEPPLTKILDDFEDILILNGDVLQIKPGPIKKTECSLSFLFRNGIKVDLLPAANVSDVEEIRRKIKNNLKNAYYYNPSFVEKQVAFILSQDVFTHTLIRLVKFWFKNLYFGDKVSGGSVMMELISVAAAEAERKLESLSMLRAFTKVLDMISQLDSLKLAFRQVADRKWERVPANELQANNYKQFVPCIVGNKEKLLQNSFIIDPANSFQDFIEQKPTIVSNLKRFASETRNLLSELVKRNEADNFMQILFQPHPSILVRVATLVLPSNICFGTSYTCSTSTLVCDMKVRNETVTKDKRKKDTIKVFQQRLFSTVNAVVTANPRYVTTQNVKEAVERLVKRSMQVNLKPCPELHDEMDVTLTIPYRIYTEGYAVRYSMIWN